MFMFYSIPPDYHVYTIIILDGRPIKHSTWNHPSLHGGEVEYALEVVVPHPLIKGLNLDQVHGKLVLDVHVPVGDSILGLSLR